MIVLRRKRIPQQPVKPLPGRQRLRTFGLDDNPALDIENLPRRHVDAQSDWIDIENPQSGNHVRLRDNASAAAGKFAFDPLIDIDDEAVRPQLQARSVGACPVMPYIVTTSLGGMPWL
jgi:hypothetical protein